MRVKVLGVPKISGKWFEKPPENEMGRFKDKNTTTATTTAKII